MQLLQFLHHQHHLLPQLLSHQRNADKLVVLKPIADYQTTRRILQRQCREQLWSASYL